MTKLWAEQVQYRGSISGRGKGFSLLHGVQTGSGVPHGLEAERSLASSAEVVIHGAILYCPVYFHGLVLNPFKSLISSKW